MNHVGGTGLCVPMAEFFPKSVYCERLLRQSCDVYFLPEWFVLDCGDRFQAFCLKAVDYSRCAKILRFVQASNAKGFERNGDSWVFKGPPINSLGEVVGVEPLLACRVGSGVYGNGVFSAPHLSLVRKHLTFFSGNVCGKNLFCGRMVVRES
jgi:hypothetical protein